MKNCVIQRKNSIFSSLEIQLNWLLYVCVYNNSCCCYSFFFHFLSAASSYIIHISTKIFISFHFIWLFRIRIWFCRWRVCGTFGLLVPFNSFCLFDFRVDSHLGLLGRWKFSGRSFNVCINSGWLQLKFYIFSLWTLGFCSLWNWSAGWSFAIGLSYIWFNKN